MTIATKNGQKQIARYGRAHHFSPTVVSLVQNINPNTYILDAGGGDRRLDRDNYINVDISRQSRHTSIVCDVENLPFRANCFGLVMSEAVLEHVKKPWVVTEEFCRVLSKGGYLYIKTAFMQPVHKYPSHYFNMTRQGLESLLTSVKRIHSGVEEDQMPSYALMYMLSNYVRLILPSLGDKLESSNVEIFEDRVYAINLPLKSRILITIYMSVFGILRKIDTRIRKDEAEKIAAGVFYLGVKDH